VKSASVPPGLLGYHRDNNRASADLGSHFADHRVRLTALIGEAGGGESLALLGAGNCNDIDLGALSAIYRSIDLIDLDREALERARDRQPAEVAARLRLHAPVDLSGAFEELPRLRGKEVPPDRLSGLPIPALERVLAAVPERYDTVVSCCLLSQLMHSCFLALPDHPQLEAIGGALAVVHLRSLIDLCRPGGRIVFATDVVSSETYPLEDLWDQQPPRQLLSRLEAAGNFLSGTAPALVRRVFAGRQAMLQGPPRLVDPWLWRLSEPLTLLVYAFVLQRRAA
jgi:hypothetical protein